MLARRRLAGASNADPLSHVRRCRATWCQPSSRRCVEQSHPLRDSAPDHERPTMLAALVTVIRPPRRGRAGPGCWRIRRGSTAARRAGGGRSRRALGRTAGSSPTVACQGQVHRAHPHRSRGGSKLGASPAVSAVHADFNGGDRSPPRPGTALDERSTGSKHPATRHEVRESGRHQQRSGFDPGQRHPVVVRLLAQPVSAHLKSVERRRRRR